MISVEEIMSVDVQTLKPENTLAEARSLMAEHRIHHLPVVAEDGGVVGLVSHRDLLAASESILEADTEAHADLPVEKFMTTSVTTVDGRAGLREAALFLQKHQYGCLPVVTDDVLQGIITDSDFVAVAINLLEQIEASEPEEI